MSDLMVPVVGLTRHGAVEVRDAEAEVDERIVRDEIVRADEVDCATGDQENPRE